MSEKIEKIKAKLTEKIPKLKKWIHVRKASKERIRELWAFVLNHTRKYIRRKRKLKNKAVEAMNQSIESSESEESQHFVDEFGDEPPKRKPLPITDG